jgi:hypothetical protein
MIENIEFCRSAFKHGVSEEDIRWAFFHYLYDDPVEDLENKFIRLGFNRSGNLSEIMYMVSLDELSANYLLSVSASTSKTPAEIISEMVREKIDNFKVEYVQ